MNKFGIGKRLLLLIAVVCLLLGAHSFAASNERKDEQPSELTEGKKVLYLSSYSPSLFTFGEQMEGINKRFEGEPIVLDAEFLDSKRYKTEENYDNFYRSLKYKLDQGLHYDAIIVGDDNGLQYLMDHKASLFQDTPIFFMGINSIDRARECSQDPLVTGVVESSSVVDTMEFAYHINPEADRMVVLMDDTVSSQAEMVLVKEAEPDFPGLEFLYINMSDYTHEEYFDHLSVINENDLVLLLSAVKDKTGKTMTFKELTVHYNEVIAGPRFGLSDVCLGEGVFGGKMVSHVDQGYAAADMAMAYFTGTAIESIPFSPESPNAYMIDYELYEKYGFDKDKLTEDIVVINREMSVWDLYRTYIWIIILVIASEAVIIAGLIWAVGARRKSEAALMDKRSELQEVNSELVEANRHLNEVNHELEMTVAKVYERDARIKDLTYRDRTTGLRSRFAMEEMLEVYVNRPAHVAVILMNLDDYKEIVESHGHKFGDRVLRSIGARLSELEDDYLQVGCFGGDEYVAFLSDNNDRDQLTDYINKLMGIFDSDIHIEDASVHITGSIGVSFYPKDGTRVGELIRYADVAVSESKKKGKNCYTVYGLVE